MEGWYKLDDRLSAWVLLCDEGFMVALYDPIYSHSWIWEYMASPGSTHGQGDGFLNAEDAMRAADQWFSVQKQTGQNAEPVIN